MISSMSTAAQKKLVEDLGFERSSHPRPRQGFMGLGLVELLQCFGTLGMQRPNLEASQLQSCSCPDLGVGIRSKCPKALGHLV